MAPPLPSAWFSDLSAPGREHENETEHEPGPRAADPATVTLDVVTVTGRATTVELRLRPALVEIWHHGRQAAVVARVRLRDWLERPEGTLMLGDVLFSLDRSVDVHGRAAISLDQAGQRVMVTLLDVRSWPLSADQLEKLRRRV